MKLLLKTRDVWVETKEQIILKEINLEISEGEFLWLEGRSGAGKSHLLKLLSFRTPPSKGDIVAVKKFPVFTGRATLLGRDIVKENLKLAAPPDAHDSNLDISELLKNIGLFARRNQRTDSLSAGEKLLLKLATFLILESELVFFDEPFGNLDTEAQRNALNAILEKNKKNTAVLIASTAHCPADCPVNTRKLNLKNGELYEE